MMAFHVCSTWVRHHLGPLIIIAVGIGFAVVGAIPVAVNYSIGVNNSSTIIGVGFIGFGLLLMVPGLCWCVVLRLAGLKNVCGCCCCCYGGNGGRWRDAEATQDSQEMMPAIEIRPSRSSSTGTDDISPTSAHNVCIFTVEDEEEANEEEKEEEEESGPEAVIVIPPIHKASPTR